MDLVTITDHDEIAGALVLAHLPDVIVGCEVIGVFPDDGVNVHLNVALAGAYLHFVVIPTDPSQPFGNAPRNAYRGPLVWQLDLVASKRFGLPWRQSNFEFRAEFFNFFNRTNFRAPNGNRSSTAFGTITATYDPRIIQFGLKLNF